MGPILPKATTSFYLYYTTDLRAEAFDLPLPVWLPFDWKNSVGYMLAILIELLSMIILFRFLASNVTFALGPFLFSLSFAEDLTTQLHSVNKCIHAKKSESKILKRLSEIIDMQADVAQLSLK